MKKFNLALSLSVLGFLTIVAVGCGSNNNGNQQPIVGQCPVGQQWVNNQCLASWNVNQFPGGPVFQQGQNCQQGQVRLNGRCFFAQSIQQACSMAGGRLINQSLCRTERYLGQVNQDSWALSIGRRQTGRTPISINGARPGDTIHVTGEVYTRKYSNPWTLYLLQQDNGGSFNSFDPYSMYGYGYGGPTVLATTSSNEQNGSDDDGYNDQVNLFAQVGGQQSGFQQQQINNNAPGVVNPTWNPINPMMFMAMPVRIALYVEAKNTVHMRLRVSAISCEDGAGNSYPCQ